jgi:hypothetical protein
VDPGVAGAGLEEEAMIAARWSLALAAALLSTGCDPAGCSRREAPSPVPTTVVAPSTAPRQVFQMLGPPFDSAGGDGDATTEDPDRYPIGSSAVIGARDFSFRLAQGGAFDGQTVLEIGPTGAADLVFRSKRGLVHTTFQLSPEELAGLQRELVSIDVYGLKAGYRDPSTEDGNFWIIHVQAAGQRKEVGCSNAFPQPLTHLSYFVRTSVVEPHRAALDQGEILPFDGPYHPHPSWSKK